MRVMIQVMDIGFDDFHFRSSVLAILSIRARKVTRLRLTSQTGSLPLETASKLTSKMALVCPEQGNTVAPHLTLWLEAIPVYEVASQQLFYKEVEHNYRVRQGSQYTPKAHPSGSH